jgi:uncharacterized alpha-E superfamily protein
MLSRVADSLYWMSRYMERIDGIMRMLKTNYASSQDDINEFSWMPVLRTFSYLDEEGANDIACDSRAVLRYMITDRENSNSVMNIITRARENARSVQDHITKELWQCVNDFYHSMREEQLDRGLRTDDPVTILDALIKQNLLYFGTLDVTMARGEGYCFINIGKFLERGAQSADILDVKANLLNYDFTKTDTTYWKYLLLSMSGYELYLKTYRSAFDAKNVIEQIILNEDFPRSVIYSIKQVSRYFERLKGAARNKEGHQAIDFMIGRIMSKVKYSTVESIMDQGGLHGFLAGLKEDLYEIGNAFNQHYFAYS